MQCNARGCRISGKGGGGGGGGGKGVLGLKRQINLTETVVAFLTEGFCEKNACALISFPPDNDGCAP